MKMEMQDSIKKLKNLKNIKIEQENKLAELKVSLKAKEGEVLVGIALGKYQDKPSKNAEQRAMIVAAETEEEQNDVLVQNIVYKTAIIDVETAEELLSFSKLKYKRENIELDAELEANNIKLNFLLQEKIRENILLKKSE